jgi:hypothetical protein
LQLVNAVYAADNHVAGAARRTNGDVQHGLHKILEQDLGKNGALAWRPGH